MSDEKAPKPRRKTPTRSKSGDGLTEARPRRKAPLRSKSGDGSSPRRARPAPVVRSKSFDDSGDRLKDDSSHHRNPYGLDSTASVRDMFQTATDVSKRGLLSTADSFKNAVSKRSLLSTADSFKNVVTSAPEQAVKFHNFLLTKPAKSRPGAIPITALQSSRNVTERQKNPLHRALSMEREPRGRGSSHNKDKSRAARSMSPHSNSNHKQRRGGRKPPERTLTPRGGNRRKKEVEDDGSNHLAIM